MICLHAVLRPHSLNPRVHAADVLRNFHIILNRGGLLDVLFPKTCKAEGTCLDKEDVMAPREAVHLLALFLSAIIHDYGHRGVTNAFLIEDGDPLAVSVCSYAICVRQIVYNKSKCNLYLQYVTKIKTNAWYKLLCLCFIIILYLLCIDVVQRCLPDGESSLLCGLWGVAFE